MNIVKVNYLGDGAITKKAITMRVNFLTSLNVYHKNTNKQRYTFRALFQLKTAKSYDRTSYLKLTLLLKMRLFL